MTNCKIRAYGAQMSGSDWVGLPYYCTDVAEAIKHFKEEAAKWCVANKRDYADITVILFG